MSPPRPRFSSASADTVTLSDDALALLHKSRGKEDTDTGEETRLRDAARETETREAGPSLREMGKSLFAIMLESLFLADLEESGQAPAQEGQAGMPRKTANPLEDSGKAATLKKLMNDVASGKADISDLPKAMAMGSGGAEGRRNSPAARRDDGSKMPSDITRG